MSCMSVSPTVTTCAYSTSTMTSIFTTPRMTSTPIVNENQGTFGHMPDIRETSHKLRGVKNHGGHNESDEQGEPSKQYVDIVMFGELFLRCMDMYSASRTVENPQRMHHNECPTEVGAEHQEESDRLVHYKSVLVVSSLPKGADEAFLRAVTLGCGKVTNIEISDFGSNVGAHIAFSKREDMVKACDQLNEAVFNNVCLRACIMDIPVSNTLEYNHSVCTDITNNKGRRVWPNRNDAADSVSSHSPSQSGKSHVALNHRVVCEIPTNEFSSAQMPPVDRRVVHEIPVNGFHATEMPEVLYKDRREAVHYDIPKCIRFN